MIIGIKEKNIIENVLSLIKDFPNTFKNIHLQKKGSNIVEINSFFFSKHNDKLNLSGNYEENLKIFIKNEILNITFMVIYSDYYTKQDDHKLIKMVHNATKLNTMLFSYSIKELDDLIYFEINSVITEHLPFKKSYFSIDKIQSEFQYIFEEFLKIEI